MALRLLVGSARGVLVQPGANNPDADARRDAARGRYVRQSMGSEARGARTSETDAVARAGHSRAARARIWFKLLRALRLTRPCACTRAPPVRTPPVICCCACGAEIDYLVRDGPARRRPSSAWNLKVGGTSALSCACQTNSRSMCKTCARSATRMCVSFVPC